MRAERVIAEQVSGVCVCHIGDRIAAYEYLSYLLLGPESGMLNAVRGLMAATASCRPMEYLDEARLAQVAAAAVAALAGRGGASACHAQREQLLGHLDFDPFENSISPSEATYLAFDRERLVSSLDRTYTSSGYACPFDDAVRSCPGHIGVELDFMRYCLERVAGGEVAFQEVASGFFASHLKEWGVLFAVVLRDKATHPALTYLSYALDKFIACEVITFRQSLPSLCVQRLLPD